MPAAIAALCLVIAACPDFSRPVRNDPRPPPPPPPPPAPAPPPIDQDVACCSVTFEGLQVTVLQIDREWIVPDSVAPPDSVFRPAPGMEFVTLELRLENVSGTGLRPFSAVQFQLVTADGSSWLIEPVRRLPALRFGSVLANIPQEGWITFEVPRGVGLNQLVWRPTPNATFRMRLEGAPGG